MSSKGHLPRLAIFILCFFLLWFDHIILSLKFEQDLISGCWNIPLSLFWGCHPITFIFFSPVVTELFQFKLFWNCLPIKVIFHNWSYSFYVFFLLWSGHISLSLKFVQDPICDCWDIPLLMFGGCLLIKVIFFCFFRFGLVT